MRICTAQTKRANTCSAGYPLRKPWVEGCIDVKRTVLQIDIVICAFKVQTGRKLFMMKRQGCLDQTSNPRGTVKMANVWLNRSKRAEALLSGSAKGLEHRGQFHSITKHGSRTMGLDIANRLRSNIRISQSFGDYLRLAS